MTQLHRQGEYVPVPLALWEVGVARAVEPGVRFRGMPLSV